jgi:hypothetical protein
MTSTASTSRRPSGDLSAAEIVDVAEQLGIDFTIAPFSVEELKLGMEVEREHERFASTASPADDTLWGVGLLAVARLQDRPDFYTELTQARAPGDPPSPQYEHADVGTD